MIFCMIVKAPFNIIHMRFREHEKLAKNSLSQETLQFSCRLFEHVVFDANNAWSHEMIKVTTLRLSVSKHKTCKREAAALLFYTFVRFVIKKIIAKRGRIRCKAEKERCILCGVLYGPHNTPLFL